MVGLAADVPTLWQHQRTQASDLSSWHEGFAMLTLICDEFIQLIGSGLGQLLALQIGPATETTCTCILHWLLGSHARNVERPQPRCNLCCANFLSKFCSWQIAPAATVSHCKHGDSMTSFVAGKWFLLPPFPIAEIESS